MSWTQLLFSGQGRINRAKYWLVSLINVVVWLFLVIVIALAADDGGWIWILAAPAIIFSIITTLTSSVKRLHDRDKSGFWILLFYGLPGVFDAIARTNNQAVSVLFQILSVLVSIWAFVEIGCLKGTTGTNAYGQDPLAEATTEAPAA